MASEYGWAKDDILDKCYLDEAWGYMRLMKRRKLSHYKMLLAIQHAEKPKEIFDMLDAESKTVKSEVEDDKLDKAAFEAFANKMRGNPKMIVKR